jgi:molecular chaperone DnaJ
MQDMGRRPTGPERGADLRYDLELTLEEAAFGVEKTLEIPRQEQCDACSGTGAKPGTVAEACSYCHGSGQIRQSQNTFLGSFSTVVTCPHCHGDGTILKDPCVACGGQGRTRKTRKVTVKIPAGVDNGSRLRLAGEGDAGQRGGRAGDLHVVIYVRAHDFFERRGHDLYCGINISFVQAALGDKIQVPTLTGNDELAIPAGTQTGNTFRLKEKGMPQVGGRAHGDLHVVVTVVTPTKLNDRQKQLLMEFAEESGEKIQPDDDKSFLDRMREALGGK